MVWCYTRSLPWSGSSKSKCLIRYWVRPFRFDWSGGDGGISRNTYAGISPTLEVRSQMSVVFCGLCHFPYPARKCNANKADIASSSTFPWNLKFSPLLQYIVLPLGLQISMNLSLDVRHFIARIEAQSSGEHFLIHCLGKFSHILHITRLKPVTVSVFLNYNERQMSLRGKL